METVTSKLARHFALLCGRLLGIEQTQILCKRWWEVTTPVIQNKKLNQEELFIN